MARKSLRECMAAELIPVVDKHLGQSVKQVRLRLSTRSNFGDAQLKPQKAFGKMFIRMILVFPVGAVATALCFSIVGLPLGIPLFMWIGSFCSKPVMKHPLFNAESTRASSSTVEAYEEAYDEYEYGQKGMQW